MKGKRDQIDLPPEKTTFKIPSYIRVKMLLCARCVYAESQIYTPCAGF